MEQNARPSRMRGLKKPDREERLFFTFVFSLYFGPEQSAIRVAKLSRQPNAENQRIKLGSECFFMAVGSSLALTRLNARPKSFSDDGSASLIAKSVSRNKLFSSSPKLLKVSRQLDGREPSSSARTPKEAELRRQAHLRLLTIAQRFNAGRRSYNEHSSPVSGRKKRSMSLASTSRMRSFRPCRDLGSSCDREPSVKTLGYCQGQKTPTDTKWNPLGRAGFSN